MTCQMRSSPTRISASLRHTLSLANIRSLTLEPVSEVSWSNWAPLTNG